MMSPLLGETITLYFTASAMAPDGGGNFVPSYYPIDDAVVKIYENGGGFVSPMAYAPTVVNDELGESLNVTLVLSTGNGFEVGKSYNVMIRGSMAGGDALFFVDRFILRDGVNVSSYTSGQAPLQPTTAGRTLDVATTGEAGVDLSNIKQATGATTLTNITIPVVTGITNGVNVSQWGGSNIPASDTAGYPKVTIKSGTGAGEISTTNGAVDASRVIGDVEGSVAGDVNGNLRGNVGGNITGYVGGVVGGIADSGISGISFAPETGLRTARSNTAQTGAAGSITLDAGASSVNNFYKDQWIVLTGGTGSGQARLITGYTGSSKVATVAPNWATNPTNTTTFAIVAAAKVAGATLVDTVTDVTNGAGGGGATAADVWAYADRALTSGVARVVTQHQTGAIEIAAGTAYLDSNSTRIVVSKASGATWPDDLADVDYTITFTCEPTQRTLDDDAAAAGFSTDDGAVLSASSVDLGDMTSDVTEGLSIPLGNGTNAYEYRVTATRVSDEEVFLLETGRLSVI